MRRSRWASVLVRTTLVVTLLAALAAAVLHWASRSDAVLHWAVAQVAQRLPGKLSVTGMRGALVRPVHIDTLEYVQDGFTLSARDVDLEWSPSLLAVAHRLSIGALRAQAVEVTLRPGGEPAALPQSLELPLPVSVDRLQLHSLRIVRGESRIELSDIDLAYAADVRFHTLRLAQLGSAWGELGGELQIRTQPPFALTGRAQVRSSAWTDWPLALQADLAGNLGEIAVQGSAQVRDLPPVTASMVAAPFDAVPLRSVDARVEGVDAAQLVPQAPRTRLDIALSARGTQAGGLAGTLHASNHDSGPFDRQRLPVRQVRSHFEATPAAVVLRDLALELDGQARAMGEATLRREAVQAQFAVTALDLQRLHSALRSTALNGQLALTRTGEGERIELDLAQAQLRVAARATRAGDLLEVHDLQARIADGTLQAKGQALLSEPRAFSAQARLDGLNPAALGDFPAAHISGRAALRGQLAPQWLVAVDYSLQRTRWRGQALSGSGKLSLSPQRVHDVAARLALGANRVDLRGALGHSEDRLQFSVQAPTLSAFGREYAGALNAQGMIAGSRAQLGVEVELEARAVALPGGYRAQALTASGKLEPGDDPRIAATAHADTAQIAGVALRSARVQVDGSRSEHRIAVQAARGALELGTTLEGGLAPGLDRWTGRVLTLEGRGVEPFRLVAPAPLSVSAQQVAFGPAEVVSGGSGRLRISETLVAEGRLAGSGSFTGVRVARLLSLLEVKSPVETDLVLGGRWNLASQRQLDGRVELFRESGDVTALVEEQRLALGIERLSAEVKIAANRVSGSVLTSGARIDLSGQFETRLEERGGRWGLPGSAPLAAEVRAELRSIRPAVAVLSRAAVVDGSVRVALSVGGSVAEPRLSGTAQGRDLSIEQVGNGLYLTDGALDARVEERRIRLEAFTIQGGEGRFTARGEYALRPARLTLDWAAERLTAVQRPDLLLVASGSGTVAATPERTQLRGTLRMDRGRAELREQGTRVLGDDVVVVGRSPASALPERALKSDVDVTLDLGEDFRVSGRGLDARVVGQVRVTSPGNAPLRGQGEIKVARGTYTIYGRSLDIDPGALYFAGPLDNPALNIRAMRKNQPVEAGVEVTGTARNPQVRLVSVPEVPDMEKLSWLTLGRRLDTTNQSDTETMQRYGAALATTIGTGSFQTRVAEAVGLDEITVLPGADASGQGGIVQLGKRVGDRLYVILEQRLSTAENIFRINYQLTQNWSVRLESGETDALDLFYTISLD